MQIIIYLLSGIINICCCCFSPINVNFSGVSFVETVLDFPVLAYAESFQSKILANPERASNYDSLLLEISF